MVIDHMTWSKRCQTAHLGRENEEKTLYTAGRSLSVRLGSYRSAVNKDVLKDSHGIDQWWTNICSRSAS